MRVEATGGEQQPGHLPMHVLTVPRAKQKIIPLLY